MSTPIVILIAAPDFVPALRERLRADSQVVTFARLGSGPRDAERSSRTGRTIVALERLFAASPRGRRAHRPDQVRPGAGRHRRFEFSRTTRATSASRHDDGRPPAEADGRRRPARSLDPGTRRAPRFAVKESTQAQVDGQAAQTGGSVVRRRAADRARAPQAEARGHGRRWARRASRWSLAGTVVWASAELSRKGPVSRIGVEFTDPDHQAARRLHPGPPARLTPTAGAAAQPLRPNQAAATESSRTIVSSRSDPVEMMPIGTPVSSSSRAM